jgi:hypothetical protein
MFFLAGQVYNSMNNRSPNSQTPDTQSPTPGLQQTIRLLARLGREKFFGRLTLSFEAGNIVTLRKEETLKPNELAR